MDYASWTHRASQFLRGLTHLPGQIQVSDGIQPPATDGHAQAWLSSTNCSLPAQLRDFVAKASRRCYISYRWKPPESLLPELTAIFPGQSELSGEADFCEAARFSNYDNRDRIASLLPGRLFGGMAIADDPERLRGRIAILLMRNSGDQISWNCKAEGAGTIVYVRAGEVEGRVLAKSFDEFLKAWEKIAYVTPCFDNLVPWLDSRTGLLNPDEAASERLKQFLADSSTRERSKA